MKRTATDPYAGLSRRERQIMAIIYRLGSATVEDVRQRLPDPPSYSAVRSALALLEDSGALRHERQGRRYLYFPVKPRSTARTEALEHVTTTFFRGSALRAAAALMERADGLSEAEYEQLKARLDELRRQAPTDE